MTQLTPHFSLDELTASDTAARKGIDNSCPADLLPHLQALAVGLEQVRVLLSQPMHITSGYRCRALNQAIGGSATSAHMEGYAADFKCPGYGDPLDICKAIAGSALDFDQLIQEGRWVHISFAPTMRRQVLTANFGPQGATYLQGL